MPPPPPRPPPPPPPPAPAPPPTPSAPLPVTRASAGTTAATSSTTAAILEIRQQLVDLGLLIRRQILNCSLRSVGSASLECLNDRCKLRVRRSCTSGCAGSS